jgi:hypothetical protein
MAMLGLYVPTLASWYSALRSELLSFPAGKYDDQVDALGLIGQLLDRITAGQRPITPRVEKPHPYRPIINLKTAKALVAADEVIE